MWRPLGGRRAGWTPPSPPARWPPPPPPPTPASSPPLLQPKLLNLMFSRSAPLRQGAWHGVWDWRPLLHQPLLPHGWWHILIQINNIMKSSFRWSTACGESTWLTTGLAVTAQEYDHWQWQLWCFYHCEDVTPLKATSPKPHVQAGKKSIGLLKSWPIFF